LIHEAGFADEDCFHYSVQGGAELDMITTLGGSLLGFEFKHNDIPRVTKSMRAASEDLKVKRAFLLYPGPDTFPLDETGRFVALAWRDLKNFRSRMCGD
jgi:hypothetical protein